MEPLQNAKEGSIETANYLLLAPTLPPNFAWLNRLPQYMIAPSNCSEIAHLLPCLVDISALSGEEKRSVERYATSEQVSPNTSAISALLTCSEEPIELTLHLEKFLIGSRFDEAILWRYFDPRVFVVCTRVMNKLQLNALLGPISAWNFPWLGCWWTLLRQSEVVEPIYVVDYGWPTDTQWLSLDASDRVQSVITRQPVYKKGEELILLNLAFKYVMEAIVDRKIIDRDDQIAYALLSLRFGRKFHDHWKAAGQWEEIAAGRSCWTDLLAKFTVSDFERMA